jgi:hypothetical protein
MAEQGAARTRLGHLQLALELLAHTLVAGQLVTLVENEVLLVQAADLHRAEELVLQVGLQTPEAEEAAHLDLFLEMAVQELLLCATLRLQLAVNYLVIV